MRKFRILAFVGFSVSQTAFSQGIPNHPAADLVLGQKDFISVGRPGEPSASSLYGPAGIAVDPVSHKVFVADTRDHRVLRYRNEATLRNGQPAEAVFGQSGFGSGTLSSGRFGLNSPIGICLDGRGRLWVADSGNHRVLGYDDASKRPPGAEADHVFGQKNFSGVSGGLSASKMSTPVAVCVDSNDHLWVADSLNNRILRFDSISKKANGADADGVLKQSDFTSTSTQYSDVYSYSPVSLCVSEKGSLFVAEMYAYYKGRVLRFDDAARLKNGAVPHAVLGMPSLTTPFSDVVNEKTMVSLAVSISEEDTLWVGDSVGRRVLRFKKASTLPDGAPADGVVGQRNFKRQSESITAKTLGFQPLGVFCDSGGLWVSDSSNNRVLHYSSDLTAPMLTISTLLPITPVSGNFRIEGTANDASGVDRVIYTIDSGAQKEARGTSHWTAKLSLKKGLRTIRFHAVDVAGNRSLITVVKVRSTGE